MREGWTYKPLEEVCSINYGTRVVQKKDKGSTYYVYGGGGATFMIDRYNREDCFIVSRFAMSPKCTRFVKGKFFLNDSGLSVSTNNELLSQAFLDKTLFAYNDLIYSMGKGLAQRNLDMPSFKKITIPIPPLSEQQRIVSELDLLASIIEKKKAQLKDYDQLSQSIFYDMFGDPVTNEKGWEVKKLGELCILITKGTTPTTLGFPFVEEGVSFVKVESFVDGRIDASKLSHITHECNLVLTRSKLENKDLLVCIAGATIGKMAVVDTSILPANTNQACAILRLKDKDIIRYILSFLELKFEYDVIQMGKGVAQPNLSLGQLRNLLIPLPPLSLQQSFAEKIEAIEKQKALIQQSITETETLFNSRMDYYFN